MDLPRPVLIIALALILLGSSGCSRVTFGYNHADWLLRYWINDYTSFDTRQKAEIHLDVDDYLRWHRKVALPEYTAFLQDMDTLAKQDGALSASDVMRSKAELVRLYRLTMTPFIRPAAHILNTLDSRQIAELRDTLAEKNREQREETLSGSEQKNLLKRAEGYIHFVEDLAGHLSGEQEEKIREMSLHIPFATPFYIEQREAKQAGLISLLSNHSGEDKIAAFFSHWLNAAPFLASPQEAQAIETYNSAMNELIARTFNLLTADQKDHLRKKISTYIGDLQKLHAATVSVDAAHASPGGNIPL